MLIFLTTLLASVRSIFRSRAALDLENLALRHQIGVLQRSAAKRLKLTSADRLLWICLSRLWHDWRSALAIVKPETVLAGNRTGWISIVLDLKGAARPTRTMVHLSLRRGASEVQKLANYSWESDRSKFLNPFRMSCVAKRREQVPHGTGLVLPLAAPTRC